MNRTTSTTPQYESSPSSSPSHNISRISIGSNATGNNGISRTNNTTLMNGNGELVHRHSPVLQHSNNSHRQQTTQQSYYTLGSPSITTSYNSEETSDLMNLSLSDENHIVDLNQKVELLQQQIDLLSQSQTAHDERYKRSKQENDDLRGRIHSLEDQLRELEINAETRAEEDEKRFRETMAKQMKLKSQECELHMNSNYQLQQEIIALQKDLLKNESTIKALRAAKESLESELQDKNNELASLDEEVHKLKLLVKNLKDEEHVKSNLISILNEELEDNQNRSQGLVGATSTPNQSYRNNNHSRDLSSTEQQRRSSSTSNCDEDLSKLTSARTLHEFDVLEANMSKIREENRQLKETNEELQAQLLNVQLEEGRSLIQEGNKSYSLADEMGGIDVPKLMSALNEQQEINARLRKYMDEILLKIVEKNPEILDKTPNCTMNSR